MMRGRRILLLGLSCALGALLLAYRAPWRAPGPPALPRITPEPTPALGSALIHDIAAPFDWYVWEGYVRDGELEPAAAFNCGPAVVAMALRYASGNSIRLSPEAVRDHMPGRAGTQTGTFDHELAAALTYWGVPWRYIDSMDAMTAAIASDHIVLVPISMQAVLPEADQDVVVRTAAGEPISGRFYSYNGGHWIIAKGLAQDSASGRTYVVAYDPDVWEGNGDYYYQGDQRYPKGINRLYPFGEVELGYRAMAPNRAIEVLATHDAPASTTPAGLAAQDLVTMPEKEASQPFWCYARDHDTQGVFACSNGQ